MEYLIEKIVSEDMLVIYSAYVEADSLEKAIENVENNSDEIDWTEDRSEYQGGITRSIHEKKY